MALQKTINKNGFELKDCYIKVQEILCNKESIKASIEFKSSQNEVPVFIDSIVTAYDINGENPIKQAYLHLKTLPEFADAVDC